MTLHATANLTLLGAPKEKPKQAAVTEEQKALFAREWAIFQQLDVDESNALSKDEIRDYCAGLGEEDLGNQLFQMLDTDHNGFVDFEEFAIGIAKLHMLPAQVKHLEVIRAYGEALLSGDYQKAADFLTDDVYYEQPLGMAAFGGVKGKHMVMEAWKTDQPHTAGFQTAEVLPAGMLEDATQPTKFYYKRKMQLAEYEYMMVKYMVSEKTPTKLSTVIIEQVSKEEQAKLAAE